MKEARPNLLGTRLLMVLCCVRGCREGKEMQLIWLIFWRKKDECIMLAPPKCMVPLRAFNSKHWTPSERCTLRFTCTVSFNLGISALSRFKLPKLYRWSNRFRKISGLFSSFSSQGGAGWGFIPLTECTYFFFGHLRCSRCVNSKWHSSSAKWVQVGLGCKCGMQHGRKGSKGLGA